MYNMVSSNKEIREDFVKEMYKWLRKILVTTAILKGRNFYFEYIKKLKSEEESAKSDHLTERHVDELLA